MLYQRMNRRGPQQMPPIGTMVVDSAAVEMLGAWISSEQVCPSLPPAVLLEQYELP